MRLNIDKKRVYKINNIKYVLIKTLSVLTATMFFLNILSGCSNKKKSDTKSDYQPPYSVSSNSGSTVTTKNVLDSVTSQTQPNNITIPAMDNYLLEIINSRVVFDSKEADFFYKFIQQKEVIYPYSELFNFNQVLNKYKNLNDYTTGGLNYFENNTISGEKVYSIVKKNNKEANLVSNAQMSDEDLKVICNIISEVINDYVKNNQDVDLRFLSEKLSDLKILNFEGFSNGYYDSTNGKMGFSVNYLKNKSTEFYKSVVEHETYHFIQSNSLQERQNLNIDVRYGFLYKFNDVEVNSLFWVWYYEAAAQSLISDPSQGDIYKALMQSMDCIKLPTVLLAKNEVDSFEKISLSKDLNDLFLYFNCKTEKEKIEILNLMYSYNIKYNLNGSSDDFFKLYKNSYNDGKMPYQISKELNNSIAQTLTKHFYKNLVLNLENKNISVNEIFSLISLFESELSREFGYSVNQKYLTGFFDLYNEIQAEFFEIIASKLNVSVSDIQQAYNSFNKYMDIEISSNSLVTDGKKNYFLELKETRKSNRINSINYFSQKYKKQVK